MNSEQERDGVNEQPEKLDSRVIPVMREAVALVQMVLFRQLKEGLAGKYSSWNQEEYIRLVGCIVNDIFGTPATDPDSMQFARTHIETIEEEMRTLAKTVPDILPHLTDALRMQTLCDREEAVNTLPTLLRARALGVLQEERTIPMPSTFMILVRKLGAEHGLVEKLQPIPPVGGQQG